MNRMKKAGTGILRIPGSAFMAACALLLAGCVTINIYFPAAAAEKMADKIIDEVWQMQKEGTPKPPAAANMTGKESK